MKKYIGLFVLVIAFIGCQESEKKIERPRKAWVFRSVLDQKPRMVTAALSNEIWVAYDAQRASLYKAWKGGVNFDGAVYTTVHGPQPTSKGFAYYTDKTEDIEWFVVREGQVVIPEINYTGHRIADGQVTFNYELVLPDGSKITIHETPESIQRGSQIGLSRKFMVEGAGNDRVGLELTVSSLINERDLNISGDWLVISTDEVEYAWGNLMSVSGKLILNNEEPTFIKSYFYKLSSPAVMNLGSAVSEAEGNELAVGAMLIEQSDCKSCHNEQVKTVGPSYLTVARKYNDTEETVDMLASKVIQGGSGVWGEAMMTAHPDLDENDINEMIRYILSLDDDESGEMSKIWHLGEKSIPINFQDKIQINGKARGLAAYKYLYSGDQPNFEVLKEEEQPVEAAIVSQVHIRESGDLGQKTEYVAVLFKGSIRIDRAGSYSFRVVSDDGSRLYLDNKQIINHWGTHGATAKDGEIYLQEGEHKLELEYFQATGGGAISLQWFNKENGRYELVPPDNLTVSSSDYLETREFIPENELVKSIPGDQQWLEGVHPAFDVFQARPDDFKPRVGGIDFLSEDAMLVCTWDSVGAVYRVENFRSEDPTEIKVSQIAFGLAEPLGMKVVDGEIYVLQKQELTRLIDHDGDGMIDEYQTVCDDWKVSANFHEFAFGLAYKEGYFYGALATAILPGGASVQPQIPDRGKIIRISKEDGELEFIAHGLRTPNGIGIGVDDEIFVADNQGDWMPASKINHLKKGAFYGSRSVDFEGTKDLEMTYPVVWLPQGEIGNSPSTPLHLDKGPYKDQMIHCEVTHGGIKRVYVEKVNGNYQGAVFRFSQGLEAGINRIQWAPDGSLITGGIGVSGNWGQTGKLKYGLQRMVYNGNSVFEMLKVKARSNGFEIEFTEPIKEGQHIETADFLIEQYYFKPTEEYGGPKLGIQTLSPKNFALSDDRKKVYFELEGLKEKHVVYFRIVRPFISDLDHELWTTEAWYTLNAIPEQPLDMPTGYQVIHNQLTEDEKAQGWKLLFDGKSTEGFRTYGLQTIGKKWIVQDGMLHFTGKGSEESGWQSEEGGDIIITGRPYKNYELNLDWKISEGGNSGVVYLVVEDTTYEYAWNTGLEMQILDNVRHPDGQIEKHRAGDLYDLIESKFVAVNPAGEWNRVRLIIMEGQLEHWLNGYRVVQTDLWTASWEALIAGSKFAEMPAFGKAMEGHIVLQDHGDKVWFRNIKIRELD